jgi:hypothetical protein
MSAVTTARTELDAVRARIGEGAYRAIRAGLDAAQDLRSAPGRDATAATRARGGGELRRQPHLAQDAARTNAAPATRDSSLP